MKMFMMLTLFLTSAFCQSPDPGEFHILSRQDLPSCKAHTEHGLVYFPLCPGIVTVTTLVGRRSIDCDELGATRFVGLVHIKTEECDQTLTALSPCEFHPFGSSPASRPCRADMHLGLVAVIGLMVLFLYVQLVMIRWVYLFYLYRRGNSKLVNVKRESGHYKFYMHERRHPDGGEIRGTGEGISHMLDVNTSFRMSMCQVAIFCLLMLNPLGVKAAGYDLLLGSNAEVNKTDLRITSGDLTTVMPLTLEFSTAEVTSYYNSERFFLDSECSGCMNLLNSPQAMSRRVEVDSRGTHFTIGTCWPLKTGVSIHDIISHSCEKRWYKFMWDPEEEWMVMSISAGISNGGIHMESSDCSLDEVEDLIPQTLPGSVVTSPKGDLRYCPSLEITATPQTTSLGSFRIFSNNEYTLANGFMTCSASPSDMSCHRHNFGTDTLEKRCCRLPCKYKGLTVSSVDYSLVVRRSPARRLKVSCRAPQIPDDCGGLAMEAAGPSQGGYGVLLQVKTVRKSSGVWSGMIPCLGVNMSVPCDGEGITLVTNTKTACLRNVPDSHKHILPPEVIRSHSKNGVGFSSEHTDNDNVITSLRHSVGDAVLGLILASPLMSLLVLVVLCRVLK